VRREGDACESAGAQQQTEPCVSDATTPAAPSGKNPRSISKRLRFEVFKRDDFTCQYCGAQPPKVVLEVDHMHPVAEGGTGDAENLITSCDKCNRGKGKKLLGDRIVRPDADLMWLKTQQETAELKRYQKAKAKREKVIAAIIEQLQTHWMDVAGLDWAPSVPLCRQLLNRHFPDVVEKAFTIVGPKVASGKLRYADEWQPYLNAVCRNMTNDVVPESREVTDLRERHEELQKIEKMLRSFLAMVLETCNYTNQDETFCFEHNEYVDTYWALDKKELAVVWKSLDEGKSWELWVSGVRTDG